MVARYDVISNRVVKVSSGGSFGASEGASRKWGRKS